jgi:nucleolar protein 6
VRSLSSLLSLFQKLVSLTKKKRLLRSPTQHPDPPPTVRLLTPKVTTRPGAESKSKSKGCAFLEFSARQALQAALRLHQSELDGRRINVELTAGGGGKSDARLAKVKERNKHLGAQRVRRFLFFLDLLSFHSSCLPHPHLRTDSCLARIDAAA